MELPVFTTIATLVAVFQFTFMGFMVGRARAKYNVIAPSVTGQQDYERVHRVHQNTMEQMVSFLPSLWLFSLLVSDVWAGVIGLVWIVGREVYAIGYTKDADKRGFGFLLTFGSTVVLFLGACVGLVMQLFF